MILNMRVVMTIDKSTNVLTRNKAENCFSARNLSENPINMSPHSIKSGQLIKLEIKMCFHIGMSNSLSDRKNIWTIE